MSYRLLRIEGGAMTAPDVANNWTYGETTLGTPEPSSLVLLVVGMISLMAYAWRKRK
jgi:hypothetical protein